jgi:hypothetical protein
LQSYDGAAESQARAQTSAVPQSASEGASSSGRSGGENNDSDTAESGNARQPVETLPILTSRSRGIEDLILSLSKEELKSLDIAALGRQIRIARERGRRDYMDSNIAQGSAYLSKHDVELRTWLQQEHSASPTSANESNSRRRSSAAGKGECGLRICAQCPF